MKPHEVPNTVAISDPHCNSTLGLCSPKGHRLDDGGRYLPSKYQRDIYECYDHFRRKWIPEETKGEPWNLVINGDAVDGDHHRTPTIISRNMQDQHRVAVEVLRSIVDDCRKSGGRYYHVRGTEAHVEPSAQNEERLAEALGAEQDPITGNHSHWVLKFRMGKHLVSFRHHIGGGASQAYEATALSKTQHAQFADLGRWGREVPQVDVRSHRHRYGEWRKFGQHGLVITVVTPGWQGITPYSHRMSDPQEPEFGGILIRRGDRKLYVDSHVYSIPAEGETP